MRARKTSPAAAQDSFRNGNGAVGANAAASSTASSASPGAALSQLYQTQVAGGPSGGMPPPQPNQVAAGTANTSAPTRPIYDPTYQGGQFPPGAPVVSGLPNSLGPSLANSNGDAASDSIQTLNYIASLPLNHSPLPGAAVNTTLQNGAGQPGGMPQLGSILQTLTQQKKLNVPPPQAGLSMMFPSSVGGGGIL